jgi:hypothetical protein
MRGLALDPAQGRISLLAVGAAWREALPPLVGVVTDAADAFPVQLLGPGYATRTSTARNPRATPRSSPRAISSRGSLAEILFRPKLLA